MSSPLARLFTCCFFYSDIVYLFSIEMIPARAADVIFKRHLCISVIFSAKFRVDKISHTKALLLIGARGAGVFYH